MYNVVLPRNPLAWVQVRPVMGQVRSRERTEENEDLERVFYSQKVVHLDLRNNPGGQKGNARDSTISFAV